MSIRKLNVLRGPKMTKLPTAFVSESEYASETGEITRFGTVIITYGEGRPIDISPNVPDIENAITWSRERTSHVIVKYLDSTYFWPVSGSRQAMFL